MQCKKSYLFVKNCCRKNQKNIFFGNWFILVATIYKFGIFKILKKYAWNNYILVCFSFIVCPISHCFVEMVIFHIYVWHVCIYIIIGVLLYMNQMNQMNQMNESTFSARQLFDQFWTSNINIVSLLFTNESFCFCFIWLWTFVRQGFSS